MSLSIYVSINLCLYQSISLSINVFINLCLYQSTYVLISQSRDPSLIILIYLSFYFSIYLSQNLVIDFVVISELP